MENLNWEFLDRWHDENRVKGLDQRRLTLKDLQPVLDRLGSVFEVSRIGSSFKSRPIHSVRVGSGETRILIWTQMHGNESTGTKAVLDLFKWLGQATMDGDLQTLILENCSLVVIPMLNPDGAEAYTRVNGQGIDLNRDVLDKKAPESLLLQEALGRTDPDYCFNMHDQRTIFSVGSPPQTATLSFLAPSEDEARTLTPGRIKTMEVIVSMFNVLKERIPNRIGRYTDEFYPTATGDNFQRMGYSTVLIESGHYPGDYQREVARKMTFLSLVSGLHHISAKTKSDHSTYFEIPDNEKFYLDAIVKNVTIGSKKADLGVFFHEEYLEEKLCFKPKIEKFEDLDGYSSDRILEAEPLTFDSFEDAENWLIIEFN